MTQPRRVVPLSADRRADFYALHCAANGEGWCHCAAWWMPTWDGWGDRSAEQNRAVRDGLFARGEHDGYLLYEGDRPVAWCQAGPRDRLKKLAAEYALSPSAGVYAITCFVVIPQWRGTGVATALLRGALDDLLRRGVRRVEAFPRREAGHGVWTGPERLFVAAGFEVVREDPARPILALQLG